MGCHAKGLLFIYFMSEGVQVARCLAKFDLKQQCALIFLHTFVIRLVLELIKPPTNEYWVFLGKEFRATHLSPLYVIA